MTLLGCVLGDKSIRNVQLGSNCIQGKWMNQNQLFQPCNGKKPAIYTKNNYIEAFKNKGHISNDLNAFLQRIVTNWQVELKWDHPKCINMDHLGDHCFNEKLGCISGNYSPQSATGLLIGIRDYFTIITSAHHFPFPALKAKNIYFRWCPFGDFVIESFIEWIKIPDHYSYQLNDAVRDIAILVGSVSHILEEKMKRITMKIFDFTFGKLIQDQFMNTISYFEGFTDVLTGRMKTGLYSSKLTNIELTKDNIKFTGGCVEGQFGAAIMQNTNHNGKNVFAILSYGFDDHGYPGDNHCGSGCLINDEILLFLQQNVPSNYVIFECDNGRFISFYG